MTTEARNCPSCHRTLSAEAQFCMHCGKATPTEPGVPPHREPTGAFEVAKVTRVLADRYRIEKVIGAGGMATVYLAEDLKHKRQVAVKVLRPELAATFSAARFLREVEIVARLSHPGILPMHDSGDAEGMLYYVMPYVAGESLANRIQREGELPVSDVLRLGREVAEALAYAHKHGIIHRDIKPANILLSEGHALVADFGIARAPDSEGDAITGIGLTIGTPQYMSPEQSSGGSAVDARTDIYALGVVLYEMLTGEPPFTGRSPQAVTSRILTERPRPLSATRDGLPPGLEVVVAKALARSAADRYPTATALAESLATVETSAHHSPVGGLQAAPTSSARLWIVLGVIAFLALGAVAFMAGRWGLPAWVLWAAIALAAFGGAMLVLTAAAEKRRQSGAVPAGLGAHLTWRNAGLGGIGAVIAWAMMAGAASAGRVAPATGNGGQTYVAILPFQNQGDTADNYIVDGITDEVRSKLAQVNGLAVLASGSSLQYRNSARRPPEIARELGVQYLLVGRVRWTPGPDTSSRRVQVVAELVNGTTGATTWQRTFDADLVDVFQVQSDVATQVAGALGAQLGAKETLDLAKRPTRNAAAWDAYLRARAITSVDPASLRQSVANAEQAVATDSSFVEAWALLAIRASNLYAYGSYDPDVLRRAREAASRAIALAPDNPAGYRAAGIFYSRAMMDAERSAAYFDTALRLAPNDPEILQAAARADVLFGDVARAVPRLEKARSLNPRSPDVAFALANAYTRVGRTADGVTAAEAGLRLAPRDVSSYQWLALAHLANGDLAGARRTAAQAAGELSPPSVAAYFAGANELSWVLDSATAALVYRLTPSAFDGNRAWWGQSLANANWIRGRRDLARAYADSALALSKAEAEVLPNDPSPRMLHALMLAYAGRDREAVAEGQRALALTTIKASRAGVYNQLQMVRILIVLNHPDQAMDELENLLKKPTYVTRKWVTIDPLFASLKGNPRFERLVAGG